MKWLVMLPKREKDRCCCRMLVVLSCLFVCYTQQSMATLLIVAFNLSFLRKPTHNHILWITDFTSFHHFRQRDPHTVNHSPPLGKNVTELLLPSIATIQPICPTMRLGQHHLQSFSWDWLHEFFFSIMICLELIPWIDCSYLDLWSQGSQYLDGLDHTLWRIWMAWITIGCGRVLLI